MTRFGYLSTYPPTRCGLATFTEALASTIAAVEDDESIIVRVDDLVPAGPSLPGPGLRIGSVLRPDDDASRARAADMLHASDVVIVQHEYGIYGGPDGDEILDVLARLRRPSIVVMHTVLATPTPHQREVTAGIAALAGAVVAMTATAFALLADEYAVPPAKLHLIPHGVGPWASATAVRESPRPVILTWGLIGPGKGIEWGIRALAELGDLTPAPLYRVLGQTHPKVVLEEGQRYRRSLLALVDELALADDVEIDGRYRETAELAAEVAAADIVLLPYDSREQATSGVLAEAAAAGKLVIATRFPHAIEVLAGGGGMLVDHQRPDQIAAAIRTVLRDPRHALAAAARALESARANSWETVAERYRELAAELAVVDRVPR